jgi:hypothetical protein
VCPGKIIFKSQGLDEVDFLMSHFQDSQDLYESFSSFDEVWKEEEPET